MALQVVQAQNQPISGVVQAPTAAPLSVAAPVKQPTLSVQPLSAGGSNYNPSNAATTATVMPNTTQAQTALMPNTNTAQAIAQTPTASSQTFTLGNGAVYDINGNQVGQNTPAQQVSAGQTFNAGPVSNAINSGDMNQGSNLPSAVNSNTALADSIFSNLAGYLSQINDSYTNLQTASQISPEEKAQQSKVASDAAAMTGLGYQAQGLYNPNNQAIALPFLTGQAQSKLVGAGIQSQLDQTVLNYMQGNRQFAFNSASTLFDASRNNLSTMLDLYTKAAPQNIGTNYNPTTGDVNAFTRNPFTGEVSNTHVANIGPQKNLTPNGSPFIDPNTGDYMQSFIQNGATPVMMSLTGPNAGQLSGSTTTALQGGTSMGSLVSQNPNPQAVIATSSGTSYDLTSYASGNRVGGPASQAANVLNTMNKLPMITDAQSATSAIQSLKANSPITGQMVMNAAQQYGVDPRVMIGVMQAETQLGTDGSKGSRGYNFGNVGNTDTLMANGGSIGFPTPQAGVDAVAQNLAHRMIQPKAATQVQAPAPVAYQDLYNSVGTTLRPALKQAPDGSAYIDQAELKNDSLQLAAQSLSGRLGIPIKNASEVTDIQGLQTAITNLSTTATKFAEIASTTGVGAFSKNLFDPFAQFFSTDRGSKVSAFQDNQEQLYQQVKTLATNSPRLSDQGLNLAQSALPQWNEFNHDTLQTGQLKIASTQRLLDNAVRTYLPSYKGSIITMGSQFMINDPQTNTPHLFNTYSAAQQFQQNLVLTPQ